MSITDLTQIIQSQSQRMQAYYDLRRNCGQESKSLLNQDLLIILPRAASLTWENYQEYDDNGYFTDVRDVVLHFDDGIKVELGCHSDIQNQEWEYIDALSDPSQDDAIAYFAQACQSPHIQTEQQVSLILQTIGNLIDICITSNSDSVSHQIKASQQELIPEA